ncbi:MAG TPA: hypothetical protein VEH06_06890 [Candidatus Bathyarchaeia archaeon]|jgi:hypothetical protein|nr:hypothetical protein [Candidatus Bathyarchaeia archaeon]
MLTLLDFENAILDLFEHNRIPVQDAKIVLWTILTAITAAPRAPPRHGPAFVFQPTTHSHRVGVEAHDKEAGQGFLGR